MMLALLMFLGLVPVPQPERVRILPQPPRWERGAKMVTYCTRDGYRVMQALDGDSTVESVTVRPAEELERLLRKLGTR